MALALIDRLSAVAALLESHAHLPAFDPSSLKREKGEVISQYGDELPDLGKMVCMPDLLGKVCRVPVELVHPNPHQPREFFDPEKLKELEALLLSNGQQKPIDVTVVELPDGRLAFGINDGERRLRVMQGLGATEILVNVIFISSADKFHEQSFLTNEGQAAHGPMEKARNYERMLDARKRAGVTDPKQDLATSIGKTVANVEWYLELLEFPSEIQRLILIDVVNPNGAHQLMEFSRVKGVDILELARQCLGVKDLAVVEKAKHRLEFRGVFSRERVEAVAEHMRSGEEGPVDGTQIDVRRKLLAAFEGVARSKKALSELGDMIGNDEVRPVLETVVKGRGGYPPEKLLEAMTEMRDALAVVEPFITRLTEAPALPDVPGKPAFLERINALAVVGNLVKGMDEAAERQLTVLRLMAQASDKKTLMLTTKEILAALPEHLRFSTTLGMSPVFEAIRRALDPHGIEVDVSEKYERTERGFEKMNAYRLKWKQEVEISNIDASPEPDTVSEPASAPAEPVSESPDVDVEPVSEVVPVDKPEFLALPPELTLTVEILADFPESIRGDVEALAKGIRLSMATLGEVSEYLDEVGDEAVKAALFACLRAQTPLVVVPAPAPALAPEAPKPPFLTLPSDLTLSAEVLLQFPQNLRSPIEALAKGFPVSGKLLDEIFEAVDNLGEENHGSVKAALLKCVEAQMDAAVPAPKSAPQPAAPAPKPAAPAPKPVSKLVASTPTLPVNGESALGYFVDKDVGAIIPMVDKWLTRANQTLNFSQRRALASLLAAGPRGIDQGDDGLMKSCGELVHLKAGSVVKTKGTYSVTERFAAVIRGANRA